jgi:hypothetical protein
MVKEASVSTLRLHMRLQSPRQSQQVHNRGGAQMPHSA